MAAEVATELCLSQLIAKKAQPAELHGWLEDRLSNNHNLGNHQVRELYTGLSGDAVQQQRWWTNFKEHNALRNRVVHVGHPVTPAESQRSIETVRLLIDHVAAVLAKT